MAEPEALVTIDAKKLLDVPGAVIGRPHVYALVQIGGRRFGRSRKIAGSGEFDLSAEREPWRLPVAVGAGDVIPVAVELWDDRGDEAPVQIARRTGELKPPWRDGAVEIGADPKLVLELSVLRARFGIGAARAARATSQSAPSATLRTPQAVTLQFTEILNLHKPGHDPGPTPGRPRRLAEYEPGYTSQDGRGRVYIDRNLAGDWTKDVQLVQLTVKLALHGAALPSGTKVHWKLVDPDDPSNDAPDFHQEWGRYVDPGDYDAAGVHLGALGDDNLRAFDEAGTGTPAKIFDRLPPWEAVSGFALSGATNAEAKTSIDTGSLESKVKFHCPDVGGTNFILTAELDPPLAVPTIPARTGIITMWKRIDVEVVRMDGAFSLTSLLPGIPPLFEVACVQLDLHPERVLTSADSPNEIAPSRDTQTARSAAWVESVFSHKRDKGWFFLGCAKRASPAPSGAAAPPLFDSNDAGATFSIGRGSNFEFVDINAALASAASGVRLVWDVTSGSTTRQMATFFDVFEQTQPTSGSTRLKLFGHDLTCRFTGHDSDGSISHAHRSEMQAYPRGVIEDRTGVWTASRGYDLPASARCQVLGQRPLETAGISPPPPGREGFFAGRTIVFSHHRKYADHANSPPTQKPDFASDVPITIVHEFTHAFGLPHKCGQWDHRAPRQTSCCMNYTIHWLLKSGSRDELDPLTEAKNGPRLCGRHAMEVRRMHLKRNRGLRWG